MGNAIAHFLVRFYRFWHGSLHLKGAGFLLKKAAPWLPGLQRYPLALADGKKLEVDFTDISSFYWLHELLGEDFEEAGLVKCVCDHAGDGAIVWDVGANGGLFSYYLLSKLKLTELVFFEPNPKMFGMAHSILSQFGNARGVEAALSDTKKSGQLVVPAGGSGTGTLEAERTNRSGDTVLIECLVGDELVADGQLQPPNLIKIDTEGHEMAVLRGLRQIMERHRPLVFFEHISLSPKEIESCVPDGYRLFTVEDRSGSLVNGFSPKAGHNCALVPQNR